MEQVVPREKWLYDDRGMAKWMGWLLSDHSAYMADEQAATQPRPRGPEQPAGVIARALQTAWETGQIVTIQLATLENGQYLVPQRGRVAGFNAGRLFLQDLAGRLHAISIDEIRNVTLAGRGKQWSDGHPL